MDFAAKRGEWHRRVRFAGEVLRALEILDHIVDPAGGSVVLAGKAQPILLQESTVGPSTFQGLGIF